MSWNSVNRRSETLAMAGDAYNRDRMPIFLRGTFVDDETELPPRLTTLDLSDPDSFHERLAAWLMKQH